MLIFTILLVPFEWGLTYVGSIRIFGGTESLMEDMPELADQEDASDPVAKAFREANRLNILMMGVNDGMTDTIMLGRYDLDAGCVDVISVPRDTYYARKDAHSAAERKINSIYSVKKSGGNRRGSQRPSYGHADPLLRGGGL